jgi:hypothetical protein
VCASIQTFQDHNIHLLFLPIITCLFGLKALKTTCSNSTLTIQIACLVAASGTSTHPRTQSTHTCELPTTDSASVYAPANNLHSMLLLPRASLSVQLVSMVPSFPIYAVASIVQVSVWPNPIIVQETDDKLSCTLKESNAAQPPWEGTADRLPPYPVGLENQHLHVEGHH